MHFEYGQIIWFPRALVLICSHTPTAACCWLPLSLSIYDVGMNPRRVRKSRGTRLLVNRSAVRGGAGSNTLAYPRARGLGKGPGPRGPGPGPGWAKATASARPACPRTPGARAKNIARSLDHGNYMNSALFELTRSACSWHCRKMREKIRNSVNSHMCGVCKN